MKGARGEGGIVEGAWRGGGGGKWGVRSGECGMEVKAGRSLAPPKGGNRREDPHADEFGAWQIAVAQFRGALPRFFKAEELGGLAGVLGADAVVLAADRLNERRLLLGADEAADHRHGAAGVEDVDHRLAGSGRGLH